MDLGKFLQYPFSPKEYDKNSSQFQMSVHPWIIKVFIIDRSTILNMAKIVKTSIFHPGTCTLAQNGLLVDMNLSQFFSTVWSAKICITMQPLNTELFKIERERSNLCKNRIIQAKIYVHIN